MKRSVSTLAILLAAAAGGCTHPWEMSPYGQPVQNIDAWVADEMLTLTSRTLPPSDSPVYDPLRKRVELFAAANETVGFQVVVDSSGGAVNGLKISLTDLKGPGTIAAENVRFFRALPVRVDKYPAWHLRLSDADRLSADWYDPLVPVAAGERSLDVPAGGRLVVWGDLTVPRTALAGNYAGKLEIAGPAGASWRADLNLQVYGVVLPDARPLAAVGAFDHQTLFAAMITRGGRPFRPAVLDRKDEAVREGLGHMRQLMRLAHEHRLDLFDTRIRPALKRDDYGRVKLDFEDYDAIVRPYLDGTAFEDRVGASAWPVAVSESWPVPADYGGAGTADYEAVVQGVVRSWKMQYLSPVELREKFFAWPYRGPVRGEAYALQQRLASLIRVANPGLPILSLLPPAPPEMTGWSAPVGLSDVTDILACPAQWFAPRKGPRSRPEMPLAGQWLSPGRVPFLPSLAIPAAAADLRAWAWFAMKYRCTGLLVPEALGWDEGRASDEDARASLFYPGPRFARKEVLGSIRLKLLRRGLQDAAMLWVLRQRRGAPAADRLLDTMVHYAGRDAAGDNYLDVRLGGWVRDRNAWTLARRLLVEETQALVAGTGDTQRLRLARAELAAVGDVRVEQIRTRVSAGEGGAMDVSVFLDLYNALGADATARVSWGPLPPEFAPVRGTDSLILNAAQPRQAQLTARWTAAILADTGKISLPLRLDVPGRPPRALRAELPMVVAAPTRAGIRVDGNLADWPEPVGSTAGEFRLVGARHQDGQFPVLRRTSVQVAYDARNLYLAFRCVEPDMAARVVQAGNQVRYDQLLACGEDLVEVLLDPGGTAASPEELYHLVVKPNGVLIAERGLRTDPPLGKAALWPVEASVAVGTWASGWTVELSIPLSAFGPAGQQRLWGVNFMRFASQGAEATSWAPVARHFYDPRNLGAMYVLPASR